MPRGNQLLLVLLLIAIIGGTGAWLYFSGRQREFLPGAIAVPKSAIFVYQGQTPIQDFKSLQQNPFFIDLKSIAGIIEFESDFGFADSLIKSEKGLAALLKKQPLLVSVHATSSHAFQLLFIIQTEGKAGEKEMRRWVEKKWSNVRIFERNVAGERILDVKGSAKQPLFSFTIIDNILALSRSTILVEDAINASKINSVSSSPLIGQLVKNSKESRVYVNYNSVPDLISAHSAPSLASEVNDLGNVLDFGSYAWRFSDRSLVLSGSVFAQNNNAFSALLSQKPHHLKMANVLPTSCAILTQHGVDDFADYYNKILSFRTEKVEAEIQVLADKKGISFEKDVLPLAGGQWGFGITDPGEENEAGEKYLIASLKDTTRGMEGWVSLNDKAAPSGDAEFKGRNYRGTVMRLFALPDVLGWMFGKEYSLGDAVYFCRLDNYVIFAGNTHALERSIDSYLGKQTLAHTAAFKKFDSNAGPSLNFSLFINPERTQALALQNIRASLKQTFQKNFPIYLKAGTIGFTLRSQDKFFFNQIFLNKSDSTPSGAEVAWNLSLEAEPVSKPYIVQNPDTRQNEVMIQDAHNNLYLINMSGKIIWKKALIEPLVGEVYQMDLYRNKDLQILFATRNNVYLLNKHGEAAANYPIRLGSPTKTGVALFILGESKEYKYYVGTENGRIYGFNINGKPLPGWSPMINEGNLSFPIKFFNLQGKDYLFGVTRKGVLKIWDIDGRTVQKPIDLKTKFKNEFEMQFASGFGQSALISVDTAGTLYTVFLNGKIQMRKLKGVRENPYFTYFDSDGDGRQEYIVSSKNRIAAYHNDTGALWQITTNVAFTSPPQLFTLGHKTYIAYTVAETNQLYLVSTNGTPYPNFPTNGNGFVTIQDMNGDNIPEIITEGRDKMLYMYRLIK